MHDMCPVLGCWTGFILEGSSTRPAQPSSSRGCLVLGQERGGSGSGSGSGTDDSAADPSTGMTDIGSTNGGRG